MGKRNRTFYLIRNDRYDPRRLWEPVWSRATSSFWAFRTRKSIRGSGTVFLAMVPNLDAAWTFANACYPDDWPAKGRGWVLVPNPYEPYNGEPTEALVMFGWRQRRHGRPESHRGKINRHGRKIAKMAEFHHRRYEEFWKKHEGQALCS
jgi:hypothetical protein